MSKSAINHALLDFLDKGVLPASMSQADTRRLLDNCRNAYRDVAEMLIKAGGVLNKQSALLKDQAAIIQRAAAKAPAPATPAPPPPATITAAALLASLAKPRMTVEEFNKIPHGQRGEIIKKIQLID
jgi:hypothetical protein